MASSWIKVEVITPDKPEIYQIAEILSIDPDAVLGKMVRVWAWADQQTIDGNAGSVTKSVIDRLTFITGFADALISVGWMANINNKLTFPNFERHNGDSSKKRALTNRRVAEHRKKKNHNVTIPALQKALPEEEEEVKDTLSNVRENVFNPNANNSILNDRVPAGGFGYADKFAMFEGWQPDQDFERKAALWGTVLAKPVTTAELAEFTTYWKAEGKAKHHDQWQMALAKSVNIQRVKQQKGGKQYETGFKFNPTSGKSRSVQLVEHQIRQEHGQEYLDSLAQNERVVWGQMDQQERHGAIIDVETGASQPE